MSSVTRPGLGGQHGDEGQDGQGRVVDDGPQAAGGPEAAVERRIRPGTGLRARRWRVRDPARVIGSVNNRRAAKESPSRPARRRPATTPGSPDEREQSRPGEPRGTRRRRPAAVGRRLTGERPMEGVTPDSLLALHAAGYRTVIERLGPGTMLDVGCGQGFESARFLAEGRAVVGADYSAEPGACARAQCGRRRAVRGPDERAGPRVRPGQLRLGVLLPPHRALRGPRGPRAPSWPGCWPTTARSSS